MGGATGRFGISIAIAMTAQVLSLSCSKSFEPAPQPKLDKGGAEIQLVQTERKLRASGCVFELLPGANHLHEEKLTCTFDPRAQGESAVADTLEQVGRLDAMSENIRQYFEIAGASVREDKRQQLEHRLLLLADSKADLKEMLRQVYDDEATVQLALSSIGSTGCEVVEARLACEEAVDLVQATQQITALKRAEEALAILFAGHAPVLKVTLEDYRDLSASIDSRRERLEDALRSAADSGPIGFKVLGDGSMGIQSAISFEGGLFVSAAQTLQVSKSLDAIAQLISKNDWAKDLRDKAYRRIVITPLVSMPVDVDFDSVTRTVFLPDTIKPEEALEFLRKNASPKNSIKAAKQSEALARIATRAKAMKDSGDLGSTGLVMEAQVARKWEAAERALTSVRAAVDALKSEGVWTDEVKSVVRVVAGDRFAIYGEVNMTIVLDMSRPELVITELREALRTRELSIAKLKSL
ncbi:MAG: hypothetical protein V4760_01190 [Bdellovibrionota bacterium]